MAHAPQAGSATAASSPLRGCRIEHAASARLLDPEAPETRDGEAARLAEQQRETLLLRGLSFCFETVYSLPSKVDFTALAKALADEVILVHLHLAEAELNQARISQRVAAGGHAVLADKVISGTAPGSTARLSRGTAELKPAQATGPESTKTDRMVR